jgi:integrase
VRKKDTEFVVTGSRDGRVITRQFRAYANNIGLDEYTFHHLRHTYASWLAQSGKATLQVMKELLGHSSINTTMTYAHLIPDNKREAVKIFDEV